MKHYLLVSGNNSCRISLVRIKENNVRNANKTESKPFPRYNNLRWVNGPVTVE